MKEHVVGHVEKVRGTMFKAATKETKTALNKTLVNLEVKVERKAKEIVAAVEKDYAALLEGYNIFMALTAAREDIRRLLGQADKRFDRVLLAPVASAGCVKLEETTAMGVNPVASAAAPVRGARPKVSALVSGTLTDDDDEEEEEEEEYTKAEPVADAALGGDVPMRDA
jgi:hypothetical protein